MTTLNVADGSPIQMDPWIDFGVLQTNGLVTSNSGRKVVVAVGGGAFTLLGSGFGGFDAQGLPTTGVIEKIVGSNGGENLLSIAGLSIDMATFRYHMEAHDGAEFLDLMFGGADVISGADQNDRLVGNAGDDLLRGFEGDDFLSGEAGQDTLVGAKGKDRFVFDSAAGSTALAPDLISDLHNNDKIDVKRIDADLTTSGDQAFVIVGAALTGDPGQMAGSYDSSRDVTVAVGDVDGDGVADLMIEMDGNHLDFTNWIL